MVMDKAWLGWAGRHSTKYITQQNDEKINSSEPSRKISEHGGPESIN